MRAIELFAGVGGFRLGLERAGHEVVWANEWDKYAAQTYDKNFGGSIDTRSITDVRAEDVPEHDLIVGGFPCQAFSKNGRRAGFEETRGTLFFDVMRIARHHRTPYLLLENVRGLLSHDGGRTFATILRTMDGMGYDVEWQIINSKDFGVPQNRERVIIVGRLRGTGGRAVLPIIGGDGYPAPADTGYPLYSVKESTKQGYANARIGDSINLQQPNSKTRRGRVGKGIAQTIDTSMHQHVIDPETLRVRRLTPLECERLQGFPDGWTEGVSDTQRYKQMGNAVTTNVIEAVASRLPV